MPTFDSTVDIPVSAPARTQPRFVRSPPSPLVCSFATSSSSGQVAIGFYSGLPDEGWVVDLYAADGRPQFVGIMSGELQGQIVSPGTPLPADVQDVDPWFHSTAAGFHGIIHVSGAFPLLFLRAWDASGATISDGDLFATSSAPDGLGGSVIVGASSDAPGLTPAPLLAWIDAAGRVTRSVALDRLARVVLVNPATGHVMVATQGLSASARWFAVDGSPLTPWIDLPLPVSATSTHLLVDGTVVLNDGGSWDLALADGFAGTVPVPTWLAARPNSRIATIRGGRGYAVIPFTHVGSTGPIQLEIVASTGESCGTVLVPPPPMAPGVTKFPSRLDVGPDGTLFQLSLVPADVKASCEFQWWPGILN